MTATVTPIRPTVNVDAQALGEILRAIVGPGHLMRELQALRGSAIAQLTGEQSPIDLLVHQYNAQMIPIPK